jgi:hypothetical protein
MASPTTDASSPGLDSRQPANTSLTREIDALCSAMEWHYARVVVPACYVSTTCFVVGALAENVLGQRISSALCLLSVVMLPPAAVSLFHSIRAQTTATALLRHIVSTKQ